MRVICPFCERAVSPRARVGFRLIINPEDVSDVHFELAHEKCVRKLRKEDPVLAKDWVID